MKFKIITEQARQRLDKFLASSRLNISRHQIQKLIKRKNVRVNEKETSPHYNLKEGDIVRVIENKKNEPASQREFSFKHPELNSFQDIKIIAETKEYLVINKPAGLAVHKTWQMIDKAGAKPTLVDFLLVKFPEISKIGEDLIRPGIVHRLDKEVSGLLIIARTQDSFDNLKEQFKKRTMEKKYTALVYGKILKDEDEIIFPIKRSTDGYKMAAVPTSDKRASETHLESRQNTRQALTHFTIIKKFINYTLLRVRIKTGRTHQIRVHMLAYGHPAVGDNLYSTKKTREQNKKLNLGRIFLVANKLSFYDLAGKRQTFTVDMPIKLKKFLGRIK